MLNVSLIDLDHLEKYVAGDDELRDEILTIFEKQVDKWLRLLDPHQADEEWIDAAHALKGASRGIGAWTVGDLCEKAETLVGPDHRDPAAREALLNTLRGYLSALVGEVRHLRERPSLK